MSSDRLYQFKRRAKNESHSGRTANIGTFKGPLKEALSKANALSIECDEKVMVCDTNGMIIATVKGYSAGPWEYINIDILASHFKELVP